MTETSGPIRPRVRHIISAVITAMSYGDVADQSEWPDLRKTAEQIVAASHMSHPEYWEPSLRGC